MQNQRRRHRVGISTQTSVEATATGAGLAPTGDESPVAELNLTSSPQTHHEENQQSSSQPARSASVTAQPLTTLAGLPRRRIQWSNEMNEFIIRAYFRTTRCETSLPGYRQRLHTMFVEEFPHLTHVTEQNLADRKHAIIRRNLIAAPLVDAIRGEVAAELSDENQDGITSATTDAEEVTSGNYLSIQTPNASTNENNNLINNTNQDIQKLQFELNSALTKYSSINPTLRPKLPKQQQNHNLSSKIKIMNNDILPRAVSQITCYEQLDLYLYCSAYSVIKASGKNIPAERVHGSAPRRKEPPWMRRLNNKIEILRRDAGILTAFNTQANPRLKRKALRIQQKYLFHAQYNDTNNTLEEVLDSVKQKISLYAKRLRRYKESRQRKEDNRVFKTAQKKFFEKLAGVSNGSSDNRLPNMQSLKDFWSGIWSTNSQHNQQSQLLHQNVENTSSTSLMQDESITAEDFNTVIKRLHNWKATGTDGIHNYWLKSFVALHEIMRREINRFVQDPILIPNYLCEGITYLIPKDHNTQDPSKYRPITCLNTFYKLTTSCVAELIYKHCTANDILAEQQKGCKRGSLGCKEQLAIDAVVTGQAITRQRNLFAAFIDYKKAFDMVPHSWLLETFKIYKINPRIITFCENIMSKWCTKLRAKTETSELIPIRRGIFQGDSLSPLWFCLCLNPLSSLLNTSKYGFEIKTDTQSVRLTHLMYMDDIKIYASTANSLEQLLNIVEQFSNDIRMEFGIEKCKTIHIIRGRMTKGLDYTTSTGRPIKSMEEGEIYKYLGMEQSRMIAHSSIKARLTETFKTRLEQLLKTLLNSRNLTTAINTYAIPIITYSAGIIKWSDTELDGLDRKVRTLMTKYRKHHPRAAVERLIISRKNGGRGLISIRDLVIKQSNNLFSYFSANSSTSSLHNAVLHADDNFTPANMKNSAEQLPTYSSQQHLLCNWKSKPLHGRHPNELFATNTDVLASNSWLRFGSLFPETEGFMVAIQDQVVPTKNYLKFIVKDPSIESDNCRRCGALHETIHHILAGCSVLASDVYKRRHDNIGKILHQELLRKYGLLTSFAPYYKYIPETVRDDTQYRIYWDRTILTDTTVPFNRPDMTIFDKTTKNIILVDFAVVNNNNMDSTYSTKIQKYTTLCHELKDLWRAESAITLPIIVSTTGLIPKTTISAIERLGVPKKIVFDMQKSVILDSCRMVREFLAL